MASRDVTESIKGIFTKGIARDKGVNKVPESFAYDVRNIRIKNGWITQRPWHKEVFDWSSATVVNNITYNSQLDELLVAQNEDLNLIDLSAWTSTKKWDLTSSTKYRFINYWTYCLVLTWAWYPFYYDGSTFAQTTSTHIANNTNPSFWARFAWFTVVNSSLNPNAILFSRPITLANQAYCYYWDLTNGSESITYDSPVCWLIWSLDNLRVFTKDAVEYMTKDSIAVTGGVASKFTTVLGKGDELASPDSCVAAWNAIFFMTANKRIKTINYRADVVSPQIADISNNEWESIEAWLDDYLSDDQSDCFCIYDDKQEIVKFWVKSNESDVNDICLVYDLNYKTFLIDDGKYFSSITKSGTKYYAGSSVDYTIYEDETWFDDNGDGIDWFFETYSLSWSKAPVLPTLFRGASFGWQMNDIAELEVDIYINDRQVVNKTINGTDLYTSVGIGNNAIWEEPIGEELWQNDLVDFDIYVTSGSIRSEWNRIKFRFGGNIVWQNILLDYLNFTHLPRRRILMSNKI